MKLCRKCNTMKNKKGFYADNICKSCARKYPRVVIQEIYQHQRHSSKTRGMPLPKYTFVEFKTWILSQPNFRALYTAWLKSRFSIALKPSVDRIKEWETYSLDNIQLMTWAENKAKGELDCKEGRRYSGVKPVCSFDLVTEEFHQQYISAHEAQRQLDIKHNTISSAINKTRQSNGTKLYKGGSFKWMYLLDFITNTLQDIEGVPRNLQVEKIHHSQINFDEDTCLVSINQIQ